MSSQFTGYPTGEGVRERAADTAAHILGPAFGDLAYVAENASDYLGAPLRDDPQAALSKAWADTMPRHFACSHRQHLVSPAPTGVRMSACGCVPIRRGLRGA